jgi:SAM-dependent methyltransferase
MSSDPRATRGFQTAVAYDRGRPPFPAAAVADVVAQLGLTPASAVLDLGAGSGRFTQTLASLVSHVIAVEPSPGMLDALRRRMPTIDARSRQAEAIPLVDASVDAVFVAEAFHWFTTAEASGEIARILRPDGHLVLVLQRQQWWERDELPWIAEFDQLLEPFWEASAALAGTPHPNLTKRWKADLEQTGLFGPFSITEHEFVHELSGEDFVALVASWTWIAILPAEQQQAALCQVRELVGSDTHLALSYRTEFQTAQLRRPPSGGERSAPP